MKLCPALHGKPPECGRRGRVLREARYPSDKDHNLLRAYQPGQPLIFLYAQILALWSSKRREPAPHIPAFHAT